MRESLEAFSFTLLRRMTFIIDAFYWYYVEFFCWQYQYYYRIGFDDETRRYVYVAMTLMDLGAALSDCDS